MRMKTNSLSLDAELAGQLGECKPGETKTITLTVTVDAMDEGLMATVDSVEPYAEEEEVYEEPAPKKKGAKALRVAMGEEE